MIGSLWSTSCFLFSGFDLVGDATSCATLRIIYRLAVNLDSIFVFEDFRISRVATCTTVHIYINHERVTQHRGPVLRKQLQIDPLDLTERMQRVEASRATIYLQFTTTYIPNGDALLCISCCARIAQGCVIWPSRCIDKGILPAVLD